MKEALPDNTSTQAALRYVQAQAAAGHFKGHSNALLVLYYLVTYMWVRPSPDGSQGRGEVVRTRAGINDIAACTALSRSTVQRALIWLAEEEWLDIERQADTSGAEVRQRIYLKLDVPGHRERERRGDSQGDHPRVVSVTIPPMVTVTTPIRVSS